ncbi:MAG: c-type cytochrome [Polyangiales bacterium]
MRPRAPSLSTLLFAGALWSVLVGTAACSSRSTREWTAGDHDVEQSSTQVTAPMASNAGADDTALVDATWSTRCYVCHGAIGKGDGPNGPMVQAKDLTDAMFQSNRTDAQLMAVISSGKGRMPSFADLPPKVVAGLVKRIRSLRAGR